MARHNIPLRITVHVCVCFDHPTSQKYGKSFFINAFTFQGALITRLCITLAACKYFVHLAKHVFNYHNTKVDPPIGH